MSDLSVSEGLIYNTAIIDRGLDIAQTVTSISNRPLFADCYSDESLCSICREVVITILSDETQGTEAMRVCVERKNKGEEVEIITPMRMLIKEMPGV